MQRLLMVLPAMVLAGAAAAQAETRADVLDPKSKAPPLRYRSAFGDYRPFAEQGLANWRRSNDEVGATGGRAGHAAGQGGGEQGAKPQPGAPESTGAGGQQHHGHGGQK